LIEVMDGKNIVLFNVIDITFFKQTMLGDDFKYDTYDLKSRMCSLC